MRYEEKILWTHENILGDGTEAGAEVVVITGLGVLDCDSGHMGNVSRHTSDQTHKELLV